MRHKNKVILDKSIKNTAIKAAEKKPAIKISLKNRLIIICACIAVVIAVSVLLFTNPIKSVPDNITITVAWNPGSTIDDIVRVLIREMDVPVTLHNVTGANGANGANTVYRSMSNGENILATNLSAFVTSEAMGFADNSHRDWESWLLAFVPAVIVVANDSPYTAINELINAIRENPGAIRLADEGYGTVSYVAAELFSSQVVLELNHQSFSGSNQVIEALFDYNADFAILLSAQAADYIRSGDLRALGVFDINDFSFDSDYSIPSIADLDNRLSAFLPFGEYFGLFVPKNTPSAQFNSLDSIIIEAVSSESFDKFCKEAGLKAITPDRSRNNSIVEHICSVMNWTLYNAGFLPANPNTLGIPKP